MNKYFALLRLNKPIGILLLLWPTLWALWLASQGTPSIKILSIFITGVVLLRSAGCIINDIFDRKIDCKVKRTRDRPITSGQISVFTASIIFIILMSMAFILVLFLNQLTIKLACIGAIFTIIYPLLKRFTNLPQLGLGITFSLGIPMAFSAVTNQLPNNMWWIFVTAFVWTIMYDTLYAMVDREDDLLIGVRSTAILFGKYDRAIIFLLQTIIILLLIKIGLVFKLKYIYFYLLPVTSGLFIYQQWLIRARLPANCFKAFLNNNWVGLILFLGIIFS